MKPGTIFISHRSEYAELVKALKAAIQETAQGQINVFISEDIPISASATLSKHYAF